MHASETPPILTPYWVSQAMNAIEQVFDKIESRFNPAAAIEFNHNFQFEIQIFYFFGPV